MENRRRVQRWLSLILPLILAGVLLVACDAGEEEGGGGGLDDQTQIFDETPVVPGDQTPMIEETLPVEGTPMVEETPVVEETEPVEEPTVEMTATVEVTPTVEAEAEETPEVGAQDQSLVVLASNLIGRNVQEASGANVGVISELLADQSGVVQYVIVDAAFIDDAGAGDAGEATTGTAFGDLDANQDEQVDETEFQTLVEREEAAADAQFDAYDLDADGVLNEDEYNQMQADLGLDEGALIEDTGAEETAAGQLQEGTVALSWDALDVRAGVLADGEVDTEADADEYHVVYTSDMALEEQQSFDPTILDEEGAILDEQTVTDSETAVPSEFANLIQLSEYNNVDLNNAQGEDLGEIEDALIDTQEGSIQYVIVDVGGFLGLGERSIAVPFDQFQIDVTVEDDAEEESVTLDATEEQLENAPEIDRGADWIPNVDVDWDAEWNEFWNDDADTDDNNG